MGIDRSRRWAQGDHWALMAVSAIDPVASMQAIENLELHAVADEVRDLLQEAVDVI